MSTTAIAARRPKWHPIRPPLPSPKILNLPRRNSHRKQPIKPTRKPSSSTSKSLSLSHHCSLLDLHQNYYYDDRKENLERLFGQERGLSRNDCTNVPVVLLNSSASSFSSSLSGGRREKVKEEEGEGMCGESSESVEEKWKFQAEILRAECNFLRMDREVALEKLDKNRLQMERTLRSAVQTVEMLRRKMDGLSKEMLQRIKEDFGSILSTAANSYLDSSASTSKRIEDPESVFSSRQLCQESTSHEDTKCTGRCKIIVRRIVDQVRAETEQWSQMQGMLGKVRVEMEDLQDSRKFWEDRALNSDHEV